MICHTNSIEIVYNDLLDDKQQRFCCFIYKQSTEFETFAVSFQ